jgi:hypothetical protein
MNREADSLRQKIAHYRRLLQEGVSAEQAALLLDEIAKAHAALGELEKREK